MKIEYLEKGSSDCPLIRIYGDNKSSLKKLLINLESLSLGIVLDIIINDLDIITEKNNCNLHLRVADNSLGIIHINHSLFECILDMESWKTICELIEPLVEADYPSYQWLDETSEVGLLLSTYNDGSW